MAGQVARQKFQNEFAAIGVEPESVGHRVACELIAEGAFIPLVCTEKPGDTGTFWMGSAKDDPEANDDEQPAQVVRLSRYGLHRYCVRNVEYELFDPWHKHERWLGKEPHPDVAAADETGADDDCPVVNVTWYDAWCFAKWVSEVPLKDGRHAVCLPSEAQWEYACRAGERKPFTFGLEHPGQSVTPDVCNFNGNYPIPDGTSVAHVPEDEVHRDKTIGVGKLGPNRWGFYQMHGNVWEWCTDWYLSSFYASEGCTFVDPVNLVVASARVLRGGSWYDYGWGCRSADRNGNGPSDRSRIGGFRVAAVPVLGAKSRTE